MAVYRISSGFGPRTAPMPGASTYHVGVDVAAPVGTPIHAAALGKVIRSEHNSIRGHVITIDHGSGWSTLYQHLDTRRVSVGAWVVAGQVIGTVGATGLATGPHLHLEERRGGALRDPAHLVTAVMQGRDWFTMATENELRAIIREEIARAQPETARTVWGYRTTHDARDAWGILRNAAADAAARVWSFKRGPGAGRGTDRIDAIQMLADATTVATGKAPDVVKHPAERRTPTDF